MDERLEYAVRWLFTDSTDDWTYTKVDTDSHALNASEVINRVPGMEAQPVMRRARRLFSRPSIWIRMHS